MRPIFYAWSRPPVTGKWYGTAPEAKTFVFSATGGLSRSASDSINWDEHHYSCTNLLVPKGIRFYDFFFRDVETDCQISNFFAFDHSVYFHRFRCSKGNALRENRADSKPNFRIIVFGKWNQKRRSGFLPFPFLCYLSIPVGPTVDLFFVPRRQLYFHYGPQSHLPSRHRLLQFRLL